MADNGGSAWFGIILVGAMLYSCSGSEDEQRVADELGVSTEEASDLMAGHSSPEDAIDAYREDNFDEDAARMAAESELARSGYDGSYGCTDDCSGHDAGWNWRAENGYPVSDPTTYGNSNSFAEGAMAFEEAVEARVDEMRDEYADGEEPY